MICRDVKFSATIELLKKKKKINDFAMPFHLNMIAAIQLSCFTQNLNIFYRFNDHMHMCL